MVDKQLTELQREECRRLKDHWLRHKSEHQRTQQWLADAVELSTGATNHCLNGRMALNVTTAARFAHALNIAIEDFSPRLAEPAKLIQNAQAHSTTHDKADRLAELEALEENQEIREKTAKYMEYLRFEATQKKS